MTPEFVFGFVLGMATALGLVAVLAVLNVIYQRWRRSRQVDARQFFIDNALAKRRPLPLPPDNKVVPLRRGVVPPKKDDPKGGGGGKAA